MNVEYVRRQLRAALAGEAPPDCSGKEASETKLKGYEGFDNVSDAGKAVLGFNLL